MSSDSKTIRDNNVAVYKETIEAVTRGTYVRDGHTVVIGDHEASMDATTFYAREIPLDGCDIKHYDTDIRVINRDCLELARDVAEEGSKVCVLNMASFVRPGGGVMNGSSAQEEDIFRRTDLFMSLYQFHIIGRDFGIKQRFLERYPIPMRNGLIYTPNVHVFRASRNQNYDFLDEPFSVDVVSIPGYKNPPLTQRGEITDAVKAIILDKLRNMFKACIVNGAEALILGALGCGAYRTPASEMAKLFHQVLEEEPFNHAFKSVYFAILDDKNSHRDNNPKGNFSPFVDEFYGT